MTLAWIYTLLGAVALQRILELVHAARNTRRLMARGGREIAREHYPYLVTLHVCWLVTMILLARPTASVHWLLLAAFLLLQGLRIWVIASLGPYWTTRIVTVEGEPLRRTGPYRWLRHPNYVVVALEIPLLPLVIDLPVVALAFGLVNLILLGLRITEEERALAPRRRRPPAGSGAV